MTLTPNELQFMRVLWKADKPLTSREILTLSVDKKWQDTSLHTILKKLLEKRAVIEHGFVKDGKTISRTFVPALRCEDYYAEVFADYPANDVPRLFSALMRRSDFDAKVIEKLEEIIRLRRVELEND